MKKLFLLTLTLVSLNCYGIITRHDVADSAFIKRAGRYLQICHFKMGEGTLIAKNWILTAGHVGTDLKRDLEFGVNHTVFCNGKSYEVDRVIIHPSFKNIEAGLQHDIALVRIKGSVAEVTPVQLYKRHDETGNLINLIGMGDNGNGLTGPQKWDKITRAATNRIDAVEEMWIRFNFDSPESKNVTDFEGISGPGDSGGPAIIEKNGVLYIAGISSFQQGKEKFGKGHYGVTEYYSRVSTYVDWIHATLNSQTERVTSEVLQQEQAKDYKEFEGTYGFRKIILRNNTLYFQREDEPLISMKEIEKDLFLWEDGNTKLKFMRNPANKITGFEIRRRNGEVVSVDRDQ